ncbi:hypothetical protein BKA60DRAFT_601355 [Fusarium oxysporum]|nr:hypothetical protein BKA60DRAFT_601355 [Fusarium oxysporum]
MHYHVKNHPIRSWIYEEIPLSNVRSTNNLLARIIIAKIEDEDRLVEIIRNTPVVQNDPNWRCRTWKKIEAVAREYVASKTAAGRYLNAADMALPKPIYDMLQGKEVVP